MTQNLIYDNINIIWTTIINKIKSLTKDIFGETNGKGVALIESWWWCKEV